MSWPRLILLLWLAVPAFAGTNAIIVVSAPRLEALTVDVLDVPSDAVLLDREQIERAHAQSVPDLLRQEANLMFRSANGKGNGGELSMRGFGENSGLRVLVVVDGQKINRSDMRAIDWQQLPIGEVESIEVLRGGQSVLYGNHALSGVINITTRREGETGGQVRASFGSFGFEEYRVRVTGAAAESRGDLGINIQRDEGYRDNALSWSRNAGAGVGVDLSETDALTLRLSGGQNFFEFPGPLTYAEYRQDPTQSVTGGSDFSDMNTALLTGMWEGERGWGNLQVNGGVNWRDTDWELGGSLGQNEQFGYSFSPKFMLGDELDSVVGGIDLFLDTLHFEGDRDLTVNEADLDRITTGPFVWARKPVTDSVSLSGGARYEYALTDGKNVQYDKSALERFIPNPFGGAPVPNPNYTGLPDPDTSFDGDFGKHGWSAEASVVWRPEEGWSVWAGYDRVYRYPALDETASYQGFALADPLNEELDPETGHNFEAGFKFRSDAWRASGTLYCLLMDNEISYDDVQQLNVNLGATTRFGSDWELAWSKELYGASVMAGLVRAVFDGGQNDGNRVPLVPDAHANASLWFQPVSQLRVTGLYAWQSSQYQGGDFDNNDRMLPSFGLLGLRLDLDLDERVSAFWKMENLLDKNYISSAYNGGYYPGSGRAFYAGIRVEF